MIPDISNALDWLKYNPNIFKNISRGIERETLRINENGFMPKTDHPYSMGSALTHKWITTDFAEILLEFVTPKSNELNYSLSFLKDLHKFTYQKIKKELLWPFSLPYFIHPNSSVKIAKYGESNLGKIKTLYRKGLKNRYGDYMNIISGVHYNFSLPINFWKKWKNIKNVKNGKDIISAEYLKLIRNYHKFGWIIPYLFGASPAVYPSFIKNKNSDIKFKKSKNGLLYLPWSTSLRLSSIGYQNDSKKKLKINFNCLQKYTNSLRKATNTISEKFKKIGLKDNLGNLKQINTNLLQMENEFYTHIRPKQKIKNDEFLSDALEKRGIKYLEIRSLDLNPFSPIGIDKKQILFLDLFLIWCVLADAPKMNYSELEFYNKNWKIIALEGRKPNQKININNKYEKETLINISSKIFKNLYKIAEYLDQNSKNESYRKICKEFEMNFKHPELTYSSKILSEILKNGIKRTGLNLAKKYKKKFIKEKMNILNNKILCKESTFSHQKQKTIEKQDNLSFNEYLKKYNSC
ncbi:glutamate--cysteine ligase [Buchnera aphidicola]|uniref:glutamate--cysteine ligase n=1 Tax=Buchnera aphidicola TaxID=9 RepID=UPI003463DE63